MNMNLITKAITSTTLAVVTASIFTSCSILDPDYKEWKRQKAANANNPFAVPGLNGETGNVPYQPLPGVPDYTPNIPVPDVAPNVGFPNNNPNLPNPNLPAAASISHTVVPGDSLWALARKYNTTVNGIKSSNNLTTDNIWVGQILTILSN